MGAEKKFNSQGSDVRRTGPGVMNRINHAHPEIEFNLIVSGKGTYFLDDCQYDLAPGTLIWLLPLQSHRLMRSSDLDMWVASIDPDQCDEAMLSDLAANPCRILSSEDAIALDRLLSHIGQDTDEPRLFHSGLQYAFRSAWHYTMTTSGPTRRPMHPAVLQALSILRGSVETPTAAEIARKCGVTQGYLGQLLIDHTGWGFVEWRNRTRLERFHILYPKSEDLLTAALDAGFGSYTQFHRVFSDLIGTTPGEWAKSGAQGKSVGLPSAATEISGSDGASARMAWYSLAEVALPSAARWFPEDFAAKFLRVADVDESEPMVKVQLSSLPDLKQFELDFLEEMRRVDIDQAVRMERIFSRHNLLDRYRDIFLQYELDVDDLAVVVCIYLGMISVAAIGRPNYSREQLLPLVLRMRRALRTEAVFGDAKQEDIQKAAAALVCQTMFVRYALEGSRSSNRDVIAERVRTAARASAIKTIGLDVMATPLDLPVRYFARAKPA